MMNEQSESHRIRSSARRLSEVLGTGTIDGNEEGDDLVPKRRSDSTRNKSKRQSGQIQPQPPFSHFVNGRCTICKHPQSIHFTDTDSIGSWSFCSISECDCFLDERNENDAT